MEAGAHVGRPRVPLDGAILDMRTRAPDPRAVAYTIAKYGSPDQPIGKRCLSMRSQSAGLPDGGGTLSIRSGASARADAAPSAAQTQANMAGLLAWARPRAG